MAPAGWPTTERGRPAARAGRVRPDGTRSYYGDLTEILFGNVLAVAPRDITISTAMAAGVLLALVVLYRPVVFACFDPVGARAVGLPVDLLDLGLYALIALAVVAGLT